MINGGVETRKPRLLGYGLTILLLNVLVHVPRSSFAIINGVNQVFCSDAISTDEEPLISLSLASLVVNIDQVIPLLNLLYPILLRKLASEGLNNKVNWEIIGLLSLLIFQVVVIVILGKILVEFYSGNMLARRIELILNRGRVGDKVDTFPSRRLKDFVVSAHVLEAAAEGN